MKYLAVITMVLMFGTNFVEAREKKVERFEHDNGGYTICITETLPGGRCTNACSSFTKTGVPDGSTGKIEFPCSMSLNEIKNRMKQITNKASDGPGNNSFDPGSKKKIKNIPHPRNRTFGR